MKEITKREWKMKILQVAKVQHEMYLLEEKGGLRSERWYKLKKLAEQLQSEIDALELVDIVE